MRQRGWHGRLRHHSLQVEPGLLHRPARGLGVQVKTDDAGVRFNGPNGQRLLIGWTDSPKSNPVADWTDQESSMARPGYKRVKIAAVNYRGWPAADWEFTYDDDSGAKYHSVDRGFVVSLSQGYGIMFSAKDADWSKSETQQTLAAFFATFQPA